MAFPTPDKLRVPVALSKLLLLTTAPWKRRAGWTGLLSGWDGLGGCPTHNDGVSEEGAASSILSRAGVHLQTARAGNYNVAGWPLLACLPVTRMLNYVQRRQQGAPTKTLHRIAPHL